MRSTTYRLVRASTLAALGLVLTGPVSGVAQSSPKKVVRTRLFSDATTRIQAPAVVSPNGKWLVFGVMETSSKSRLTVTRIGTKKVSALTSKGWWDANPEWSPSSDRIFFISNRPAAAGDLNYYAMVLRIDPASGRAVGEPRQLTKDPVAGSVRISPDGKLLAYIDASDRRLLRVIPVDGGESRVVARIPVRSGNVVWSRDGKDLYFVTNVAPQKQRALNKVSLSGGEIVTMSNDIPPVGQFVIGRGAETFVYQADAENPRDRFLKIFDRGGKLLRTVPVSRDTRVTQLTADGRSVIAVENNIVAPTRIMPIEGGSYRDITPPVSYDWVMRWSKDGKTLYTWTEQKGEVVLAAMPINGGSARTFPETAQLVFGGGGDKYLFQTSRMAGNKPRSITAIDVRTGARYKITESAPGHNMIFPYEPGGTWAAHDELVYLEHHGDLLTVKAWSGPDSVRTLRSLPASLLGRSNIAIHGNLVVWQEERGDSVDLLIAEGNNAQPRRLLTMPVRPGVNEVTFSNDGRLLSMHYARGPGSPDLIAFVDPSGIMPPRIVDTGLSYWYWPRWMPDDSGVLVIGGGAGSEAHVVRIPVAEGAKPVTITQSDSASKWGFEVSPDGRYIAYPGEIWKGSSVWKISIDGTR